MKNNYPSGQKVASVTRLPVAFIKVLGRIGAHSGEDAAAARVNRFVAQAEAIEAAECLMSENFLSEYRSRAIKLISKTTIKDDSMNNPGNGKIQKFNHRKSSRNSDVLKELFANIENGKNIFEDRISIVESETMVVIDAYIEGLAAGGLKIQNNSIKFPRTAVNAYNSVHKEVDDKISASVK